MTQKECAEKKGRQLRAAPGDALSDSQKEGEESAKGARKEHGGAGGNYRKCGSEQDGGGGISSRKEQPSVKAAERLG